MTPEQQAIRQHLSKPAPTHDACGCLGPQALPGQPKNIGTNWDEIKRYPACPCSMSYYEIVEGNFYRIETHRSPDGITHSATLYGPVGGPYLYDEYGRSAEDLANMKKAHEAKQREHDLALGNRLRATEQPKPVGEFDDIQSL